MTDHCANLLERLNKDINKNTTAITEKKSAFHKSMQGCIPRSRYDKIDVSSIHILPYFQILRKSSTKWDLAPTLKSFSKNLDTIFQNENREY